MVVLMPALLCTRPTFSGAPVRPSSPSFGGNGIPACAARARRRVGCKHQAHTGPGAHQRACAVPSALVHAHPSWVDAHPSARACSLLLCGLGVACSGQVSGWPLQSLCNEREPGRHQSAGLSLPAAHE
eukprot:38762-Chlamydomonas_euryale.AAC.1